MNTLLRYLPTALLVIGLTIAFYFIFKKFESLEAKASGASTGTKQITTVEHEVLKSQSSLSKAQKAELAARIQAHYDRLLLQEAKLQTLQEQDIAGTLTEDEKRQLEEAEQEAAEARKALIDSWKKAANIAEEAMNETSISAGNAVSACVTLATTVDKNKSLYETTKQEYDLAVKEAEEYYQSVQGGILGYRPAEKKRYEERQRKIANIKYNLDIIQDKYYESLNNLQTAKLNAVHILSNYNDCIERVLSISAEIKLLNIILAVATRLDGIAGAAADRLNSLQKQIDKL